MDKRKLDQRIHSLASKTTRPPGLPPVAKKPNKRAERQETYKFGEIGIGGGELLACLFLNFSDGGARIKLHCAAVLPQRVRVSIPSTGFGSDAEIRWQNGAECGLKFVDEA